MMKLDLKEAYHSVPVTHDYQRYLAFLWDGKCYVYFVLPFGLGPAPRVFTKITKQILVHIRRNLVIRCVMYSDNILISGRVRTDCLQKAKKVMTLLQECGFTINMKNSILGPTQQIVSGPNSGFNPDESVSKVLDLIESCQAILSMTSLTARSLASLQGKMSSCLQAVLPAPTFYRAIQADIHQAIGKTNNFSKKLILSSEAKSEIQWWIVNVHQWNGCPVHLPPPSLIITTDAAKKGGWGGIMQQIQNSGQVNLRGGFSPHKHFRTKGSPFCSEVVCKSLSNDKCSCEAQNRQHICSSLHQSSGGNKVSVSVQSSSGGLEVVSASSDNSLSRASPRNSQLGCRPSVTHFQRSHRVDDQATSPQRNIIITSSKTINRPACFSSEQTVFQSFAVGNQIQTHGR